MINVEVEISGIIMYCDESILGLNLGRGYSLEKIYLEALPYKDQITDGRGVVNIEYLGSKLEDADGEFFICLHKHDVFQIDGPNIIPGVPYSVDGPMCQEQLEPYKDGEMAYLYEIFSLLHLFQEGNIGFYDVIFEYKYNIFGIMNNKVQHKSQSRSRNVVDSRKYMLSEKALADCNQFLLNYIGQPFMLFKPSIDEFIWGLEQIDEPTGFEQYTTALEMTLLERNAPYKKKMLANRVAVLIGASPANITQIYTDMTTYYRFRSESLHDGEGTNISTVELRNLEGYVRSVCKECLTYCKQSANANPAISWAEIKQTLINDLIVRVNCAQTAGTLPA